MYLQMSLSHYKSEVNYNFEIKINMF
jgi:hypothetical protein